jgi:hypothetical protein
MSYDLDYGRADLLRSTHDGLRIGVQELGIGGRGRRGRGLDLGMRGRQHFVMRNEERVDGSMTAEVRKGNHEHRPFGKRRGGELQPNRIASKMNLDRRKVNTLSAREERLW